MTNPVESSIAPAPTAFEVCQGAIEQWKASHYPLGDFERETLMVSSRVKSWISARSVLAGVHDIFSASRPAGVAISHEVVTVLADDLARKLMEEGMLIAQPRRAGALS